MNEEGEKAGGEASPLSPLLANQHLWATAVTVASLNEPKGSDFCGTRLVKAWKKKYPGLKHKGDSDFTLNPHEAFQGCHFSAVRGTGLRSHWEPSRASLRATRPLPPVFH